MHHRTLKVIMASLLAGGALFAAGHFGISPSTGAEEILAPCTAGATTAPQKQVVLSG
jgi:hypothetical protein